jgi:hypothetical protein
LASRISSKKKLPLQYYTKVEEERTQTIAVVEDADYFMITLHSSHFKQVNAIESNNYSLLKREVDSRTLISINTFPNKRV